MVSTIDGLVQVDPVVDAACFQHLKLKHDAPVSNVAFVGLKLCPSALVLLALYRQLKPRKLKPKVN